MTVYEAMDLFFTAMMLGAFMGMVLTFFFTWTGLDKK